LETEFEICTVIRQLAYKSEKWIARTKNSAKEVGTPEEIVVYFRDFKVGASPNKSEMS
jgi:hypothetical protein